ncbi:MAG: hypothetical protein HPY57_13590 [Ignavibacteria bacterium]|nr:hypothetical protein [Ignavibacteria bacterium]
MKYLHTYEKYLLILEVGECSVEPYKIDNYLEIPGPFNTKTFNYIFNTDSGLRYSINIMRYPNEFHFRKSDVKNCEVIDDTVQDFYDKVILVSYFTFYGEDEEMFYTYDDVTIQNKGELYKIMSTLKWCIEDYLNKNNEIKYIFIGGQRGKKGKDKEQRDNLYLYYFKKNKPNWQIGKIYCDSMREYYYIIKIKD